MALPKLNIPQYKVKLPSSGKEINMRPFLVKEEKVLMIALESQDAVQITTAVREIILHCTDLDNLDDCTTVDIEYLFLQLRAKSVGEKITLQTKCTDENCDGLTKIVITTSERKCKVETSQVFRTFEFLGLVLKTYREISFSTFT